MCHKFIMAKLLNHLLLEKWLHEQLSFVKILRFHSSINWDWPSPTSSHIHFPLFSSISCYLSCCRFVLQVLGYPKNGVQIIHGFLFCFPCGVVLGAHSGSCKHWSLSLSLSLTAGIFYFYFI